LHRDALGKTAFKSEERNRAMSIKDKVTGKAKQVAGDLADEPSLRRKGR
jgi:uncharacterized protein YjbJ (UPF0337 family)